MGKLKLLTVAVMSLTLTFTPTVHSQAKVCTKAERMSYTSMNLKYALASLNQTPEAYLGLTEQIDKAIKVAKNKKWKALVKRFQKAVLKDIEDKAVGVYGSSSSYEEMFLSNALRTVNC